MTPFVIGCVLFIAVTEAAYTELGTVYADKDGRLSYVSGKADKINGIAYGSLEYTVQENGWAILNIAAGFNRAVNDDKMVMMAAGYLEGALTNNWFTYASMLRIYKHYAFNLQDSNAATKVMSFSSYPAYLSSLDDFYLMDSGLVMLQTTNGVFNHSIYSLVTHDALLAWQRVRIANWLATNGKEWSYYVSQYNSGTYNNQYMVLDLNLIRPQNSLPDNTLWVVEQLPGLMVSGDQTTVLREGYWSSYNVPFYEEVFQLSGYADAVKQHGEDFTHDLAVRAKIFRRDHGKVTDMKSYQTLMQSNEYKTDPYSDNDPMGAICSRGDLGSPPQSGGCTDSKVTDYHMAKNMTAYIRNGPTHQDLTPFQWSNSPFTIPHLGQPDLFNFDFVSTSPSVP